MLSSSTDQPLAEAVASLDQRTPLGSAMNSREWERVPAALRMRALFSATMEDERVLQDIKTRLASRLALVKPEGGSHMDRGLFIEEMRKELTAAGYKRGGVKRGSLRDMKSSARLGLIWDMNLAQAQGFAKWKAGMDPDMLAAAPAQELIRIKPRREIRDWPLVWAEHGGTFHGEPGTDYPYAPGRMVAVKTSPILRHISRFGTPWPPFDWGSGMGLKTILRAEAERLRLISPEDIIQPLDIPFNDSLQASLEGLPEDRRRVILKSLLGDVEIAGDVIRLLPAPAPVQFVLPAIAPQALSVAQSLSADATARVLQAARRTVAYQRLAATAGDFGQTVDDAETVARAVSQYLAPAAANASRISDMRDAAWSPADFAEIQAILSSVLA
ncbi:MAG: hypothetical protein WCP45_11325 [Verrucomicrobiota bacterium]